MATGHGEPGCRLMNLTHRRNAMRRITGRKGWLRHSISFAAYELPPGERITNLPAIPRNMPQKEAYENYDPVIGRNFDIKNLWLRADLRVRPEWRNNACFGSQMLAGGVCNSAAGT